MKIRAKRFRRAVQTNPEGVTDALYPYLANDRVMKDIENMYRYNAIRDLSEVRTISKHYKVKRCQRKSKDDYICPICCD